jgi:transmembrane sensor
MEWKNDDEPNAMIDLPHSELDRGALMREAADWWMRVHDASPGSPVVVAWLEWMDSDPRHRKAFERVVEMDEQLRTLDASTRQQLVSEFDPASRRPRRWLLAVAAVWVVFLCAGGFLYWHSTQTRASWQQYRTAIGVNRHIVLPDGSQITMGGSSQLRVRLTGDQREVVMGAGEAYFQVAHEARRPFSVRVGALDVRDVGTEFDVRQTGARTSVAMVEGLVRITDAGRALDIGAGMKATFNPGASGPVITTTTAAEATAWRDNRLEFTGEPLVDVIANVNRYSPVPLRLIGPDVGDLSFTGSIRLDSIADWARALPQVLPVRVSVMPGEISVTRTSHQHRQ